MNIDKKIIEELKRYNYINKYIIEQTAGEPPVDEMGGGGGAAPLTDIGGDAGGLSPNPTTPPTPGAPNDQTTGTTQTNEPTKVDIENDPDVEEVGTENEESEDLDITDLVNSQKNIEEKQKEYFDNLFKQLGDLEKKVGEMDNLVKTINNLESKIDKIRPKTPEEKLELRSLDSGPFKQKLSDFFVDKKEEMEKSGKNEYILTSDEIKDYTPGEIEDSFYDYEDEHEN